MEACVYGSYLRNEKLCTGERSNLTQVSCVFPCAETRIKYFHLISGIEGLKYCKAATQPELYEVSNELRQKPSATHCLGPLSIR
jgi:hypothetical protein